MSTLLFLLLTLCKFNSLRCELSESPGMIANNIDNDEPSNGDISTLIDDESYLPDPISSINIDYANNALILHFRKNDQNLDGDDRRRSSILDKNFMRFGRSGSGNLMRFGKRQAESLDADLAFQVDTGGRESRGDNFLRFGRSAAGSLMRFGRAEGNMGSLGSGTTQNRIKLSRQPLQNPMRFGRSSDFMRFGRGTDSNLMRFGRPDQSFMRFGRNNGNLMRFGRPDSFMRLGRTDPHLMRFGRSDKNFMRFGKLDQNFMRFGKRMAGLQNKTSVPGGEDSLDKLWKSDDSSLSESEPEGASEDKSENIIPSGFIMAQ